jgi:hypothetical protein
VKTFEGSSKQAREDFKKLEDLEVSLMSRLKADGLEKGGKLISGGEAQWELKKRA